MKEQQRADGRRARRVVAIALAGIALGGLAAAGTTAAWTDQTHFAASAGTGSANLQGSVDGTSWLESSSAGSIELNFPAIADLRPGDTSVFTVRVRNTGGLPATLTSGVVASGALFAAPQPVTAVLTGLPGSVAAGATVTATLTVTAPAWTGQLHQGEAGSVVVTIIGTV